MKHLTVEAIRAACGGALSGHAPAGEISAVTTDSRAVTPGCLFAAIRGARADGHDFVPGALAAGAACCLAEHPCEGAEGCVIRVPDTVTALQQIAGFYRGGFSLPVVGVTGSVGKTTAKEMLSAVLSRKYRVHKTAGNFNNDLGVPLTLFGLTEEHTAAVVELGVSHPGDMDRIAAVARPTLAFYTNIGDAHLEYLGSREGVLLEKSRMNRFLPENGIVFCNGDDPLLAGMDCGGRQKISYGLGEDCAVRGEDVQSLPDGSTGFRIRTETACFPVTVPAYGEHMVYAALGAAAVGLSLELCPEEIRAGIAAYVPVGSRARLLRCGELTVIDDCYNANPTSVASALRSLAGITGAGRRVCILGDMLELGEHSDALHYKTGALAKSLGIDLVLTTGDAARRIAAGAAGWSEHFPDKASLIAGLKTRLQPGDAVLVKASRGAHFEEITAALETLFP